MSEIAGEKYLINGLEKPVSEWQDPDATSAVIYDVIRIEEGIPIFLEDYLVRLENSFRLTKSNLQYDKETIVKTIRKLVEINNFSSGPLKLIFSCSHPETFIAHLMKPHLPKPEEYQNGVKTILMSIERNNPNAKVWNQKLRDKTIQLLEGQGAYEAILVNKQGFITEGSRSNIFFVKGDTGYNTTKDLVLQGITRKKVLEVCRRAGIKVEMKNVRFDEVDEYEVAFLTGTSRKIVPIRSIDNYTFSTDHKLLHEISDKFEELVEDYIKKNK